jgi:hypothetical protein
MSSSSALPSSPSMSTTTVTTSSSQMAGKLAVWCGLTSFFLMWSFLYIVLTVFRPTWVCCVKTCEATVLIKDPCPKESSDLDAGRAFMVSFVVTLIVMLLVYLVMASVK